MTYNQICEKLKESEIESAEVDASLLIEHFCRVDRSVLMLDRDKDFSSEELERAVEKRCRRYPLQYILGHWGFWDQTFEVDENCLIPRADTELLVQKAVQLLPENARFIDLCTGSGCVAISVLAQRKDCTAVAVEISEKALEIAGRNAEQNGVGERIGFLRADVLSPEFMEELGSFDAILSNPPYIKSKEINSLSPELQFEPRLALDGGEDGLDFYRVIIREYKKYLRGNGVMLLEIGFDQGASVSGMGGIFGFCTEVIKDLGGNDRVVKLGLSFEQK